ncbi:MAG: hypothetical protein HDQ44_01925 [Desulfovibrio sp.]|nr:hypothetical protein [Desulfovibrio sp.]
MSREEIKAFANQKSAEICAAFKADPENLAAQREQLYDLKLATSDMAAKLCGADSPQELTWDLAKALPDYSLAGLYQTRASLWGVAAAVIIGWILGGILATVLNFLNLGGDILRPLAIFALLWAGEYLTGNPRARGIVLTLFGLGALSRIAAGLAGGAIRGFGAVRGALAGLSAGAGFLRLAWLWFGALLLFVFFSRKVSGLNIPLFQEELARQIAERLELCCFMMQKFGQKQADTQADKPRTCCPRPDCPLASAAISLLPTLEPTRAAWLSDVLKQAGYEIQAQPGKYLIWNPEEHAALYDAIGLVAKGDRCLILRQPMQAANEIRRGLVQRVANEAQ